MIMEELNIAYTGITQATSDLDCHDGDLSLSHNIILQNGAMRPVILPDAEFTMGSGELLIYVHSLSGYKNYLYVENGVLKAFRIEDGDREDYVFSYSLGSGVEIKQVQSIGNTVIVLASDGIHYFLFKDNNYKYLGNKMPEVGISWGLVGSEKESDEINVDFSTNKIDFNTFPSGTVVAIPAESSEQIYNQLIGTINKMFSDERDKGCFVHPFFVRYAYNTVSGYTMQSPPVLMLPNTRRCPGIQIFNRTEESGGGVLKSFKATILFNSARLYYRADEAAIALLEDWSDIIMGVDVFVSDPIQEFVDQPEGWTLSYGGSSGGVLTNYDFGGGYMSTDGGNLFAYTGSPVSVTIPAVFPPRIGDEEFAEKAKNASVFWKVKSIPLSELEEVGTLAIDGNVLQNLGVQETLADDYCSHDVISGGSAFVYNSRLNLSNIMRKPFVSPVEQLVTYLNAEARAAVQKTYSYKVTVFINNGLNTVKAESQVSTLGDLAWWVYYPNPNAFRMIIEREDSSGTKQWADLNLAEHTGLNGAYYYTRGYIDFSSTQPSLPAGTSDLILEPDKIYTSEVGNPFYFPLGGINTIGTGEIVGISSTTRALSQGQFGQFPLLVFATDGIWAMEVSDTGLYSAKQPISRDVCSNPASITQIDGAIIFVSDKGVMLVDGSRVELISAELDGPSFDILTVNGLSGILQKEGLLEDLGSMVPAKAFFQQCRVAYDYPNARLIFFQRGKMYAYVYSLLARTWATITSDLQSAVADYPGCYVQLPSGGVVDISQKQDFDSQKTVNAFLLTRPLKLGDDVLKTVNAVINRGNFLPGSGAVILFASSDGQEYIPIGSAVGRRLSRLQGSPWRYFRVAVTMDMGGRDSLSATSVYFTRKWRNKPR